jgi:hypothetical protein
MERSLGDVLISSRRKSGIGGKGGKAKCKDAFKVCKGGQRIKNSQGDKCKNIGKGIEDTAAVQRAVEIAIPSKPAAEIRQGMSNSARKSCTRCKHVNCACRASGGKKFWPLSSLCLFHEVVYLIVSNICR